MIDFTIGISDLQFKKVIVAFKCAVKVTADKTGIKTGALKKFYHVDKIAQGLI